MENKNETPNQSMIAKSLDLVELLAQNPVGLTLQEIYTCLHLPKSSVHKMATILFEKGYLDRGSDLRYKLSGKFLQIGLAATNHYNLIECSMEDMKKVRDRIGESIMIGSLLDNEVILLNQIPGNLDFVFTLRQGMRFNLYSTAPGKVMLAFLPEKEQTEIIKKIRPESANKYTITDKKEFQVELKGIYNRGYAVDKEETVIGVHCIAAPVFNEQNQVVATIWTSGPAGRLPIEKIPSVGLHIKRCAHAVSEKIGYRANP